MLTNQRNVSIFRPRLREVDKLESKLIYHPLDEFALEMHLSLAALHTHSFNSAPVLSPLLKCFPPSRRGWRSKSTDSDETTIMPPRLCDAFCPAGWSILGLRKPSSFFFPWTPVPRSKPLGIRQGYFHLSFLLLHSVLYYERVRVAPSFFGEHAWRSFRLSTSACATCRVT